MILWMSSEADASMTRILSKLDIPIEKHINAHLKEIGYENEKIKELLIVIVLRDDDFSVMKGGEGIKKHRGKLSYGGSLRMDYNAFKNATDEERVNLILKLLLKSFNLLEEKGIEDLEVVKEFIESCKY